MSWEYLIEDVQSTIRALLSPNLVNAYCLARTCRSEWELWLPRASFNDTERALLVVQAQTPLRIVNRWMKAMEDNKRFDANDFKESDLGERLAREGWSLEECVTALPSLHRWHRCYDLREDMLIGYLRGGHMHRFTPLWEQVQQDYKDDALPTKDERRRRKALYGQLRGAAAEAGQYELFCNIVQNHYSFKLMGYSAIHVLFRTGRLDFWERGLKEHRAIRVAWNHAKTRADHVLPLLTEALIETFDHRLAELALAQLGHLPEPLPDVLLDYWTSDALIRCSWSDIHWLHTRGYLMAPRVTVHFNLLCEDVTDGRVDAATMTQLAYYFTFNPTSEFLWKEGYYKGLRFAHSFNLPLRVCKWLEMHGLGGCV